MRAAVICCAWLAVFAPAHAAASYAAPEGCPDEASFWSQVRARSAAARSSTSTIHLRVVVTSTAGKVNGVLAIDDRPPAMRSVSGARCEEVIEALALITALAFERRAAPEAAPIAVIPLPVPGPPQIEDESRWAAGAHGAVLSGVIPGLAISVPIFVEYLGAGDGPTARVAIAWAGGSASQLALGAARFDWVSARLSGCTAGLASGELALRGCVLFDAGLMFGSADGVARPADSARPWLAAGLGSRLKWAVSAPFFLELEAGAVVPILRDRFFFAPDRTVHQAAIVVPFAEAGVGVTF